MPILSYYATSESQDSANLWTLEFNGAPAEGKLLGFMAQFQFFQNYESITDYPYTDFGDMTVRVYASMGDKVSLGSGLMHVLNPVVITSTPALVDSKYAYVNLQGPMVLKVRPVNIYFATNRIYVKNSGQIVVDV